MDGEVIYRMRQLAKERNIQYEPSHDARIALNGYCDFKGLSDPMDDNPAPMKQPIYNPGPPPGMPPPSMPPPDFPPGHGPSNNNFGPPPSFPPGQGGPGGNVMAPP